MADQVSHLTAITWSAIVVAVLFIFMCVVIAVGLHLHARMRIMLDMGYGWKDAGVLLRRRRKKGLHARLDAERVRPARVEMVPRLPDGYVPPSAALAPPGDGPGYTAVIEAIATEPVTISRGPGGTELMPTITIGRAGDEQPG